MTQQELFKQLILQMIVDISKTLPQTYYEKILCLLELFKWLLGNPPSPCTCEKNERGKQCVENLLASSRAFLINKLN